MNNFFSYFHQKENIALKKQIVDMEKFLADYGLEWVGGKEDVRPTESFQLDIDAVKQSIRDLNVLAGNRKDNTI
jgi:hypothetical protein